MPKELIACAKNLRRLSTDAERTLWCHIRAKRLEGLKFRRQHPMGKYVVDFVCLDRKLVIELDGGQHAEPKTEAHDRERDKWLEKEGYKVLRFWDNDVLLNTREILQVIQQTVFATPSPSSPPLKGGEQ